MTLGEQLQADLKASMMAKDEARLSTLRLIRAEILKKEKEKVGTKVDDPGILAILQSMAKQRRDSIEQFRSAGRTDLVDKEQAELDRILSYLPAEVSDEELAAEIDKTIAAVGAVGTKDIGKVMGPLLKALKATGKTVDGQKVNGMVRKRLEG